MKILMLSKDMTLISENSTTFGDALSRHQLYLATLRRWYPQGEIRIITYSQAHHSLSHSSPCPGLQIWGTASRWRAMYIFDCLLRLSDVLAGGWRPDIVTVQTPWEEGYLGWLLSRCIRAKYIPQLHFDLLSQDWLNEHWLNPWRRRVASFTLRHADHIRGVSHAQCSKLVEYLKLKPERISVVPVGVNFHPVEGDSDDFKARIHPTLRGKLIVLFVGRFCRSKNLELWIKVAERIHVVMPEVAFVLAGDGPLMPQVRRQVLQAGMEDNFHFLGIVPHAELPVVYAAADVFLLTSHHEGFGRVIVEAGLAGVPTVATKCTGPEDIIEDGCSGYLVASEDCEGLSAAMLAILRNTDLRKETSVAIRKRVRLLFDQRGLAEQLIKMWSKHEPADF